MQLPFQVPAITRFNRCFAGEPAAIVPAAAKKAKPKKSRGSKDGYGTCGGQFTMQCPAGDPNHCCDPDMEMCISGRCYPYV
jgi:hypothetical protein